MSIARTHHTKDYTCMSNYHFKDKNLSLKAKGLLSMMLSLPEKWNYSVKGLAALSSDGDTSVRSAIKELEDAHYLERTPVRESGKIIDWEYDIYEIPRETPSFYGNLTLENLTLENLTLENKDNKVNREESKKEQNKKGKEVAKSKPVKKNLYQKCADEISLCEFPAGLDKAVRQYLAFRLRMTDKPIYAMSQWKAILNKLEKLAPGDTNEQIAIVEQSIEKGYASFFPVNHFNNRAKKRVDNGLSCEQYTAEEMKKIKKWQKEQEAKGEQIKF